MKKRIIALLLGIIMAVGTISPGIYFAETSSNGSLTDTFYMAEAVFKRLGVFSSIDDVASTADEAMTRGRFSEMLAKILGVAADDVVYFYDVKKGDSSFKAIGGLVKAGIISRSSDGSFRPNDTITYLEACKMVLCAAGYGKLADVSGGFPAAYTKLAMKLDLSKGVNSSGALTIGDGVTLLFNGVTAPMYDIVSITMDDGPVIYEPGDDTILGRYHNIWKSAGTVEAFYGGRTTDYKCKENEVQINGIKFYKEDGITVDDMLGKYTNYLYMIEKDGKADTVIYIAIDSLRNETVEFTMENYEGFSVENYEISWGKEGSNKIYKHEISRSAMIVCNGDVYTESLAALFAEIKADDERGKVTLANIKNGVANLVVVEKVHPVVVSAITKDRIVFNRFDNNERIDLENADFVKIYDENGDRRDSDPAVGEIFEVAVSTNGSTVTLRKLVGSISASVDKKNSDGSYAIMDEDRKVDKKCKELFGDLEINADYIFTVDNYGYIVWYDKLEDEVGLRLGYLVDYHKEQEAFETDFFLKIYDAANKMTIFKLAKGCTVDGSRYKTADIMADPLILANDKGVVEKSLIRFRTNADNEIIEIDTSKVGTNENPDYTLTRHNSMVYENGFGTQYVRATSRNGQWMLNIDTMVSATATKMFTVPWTDEDGYLKVAKSYSGTFSHETKSDGNVQIVTDPNGNKLTAKDYMYSFGDFTTSSRTKMLEIYNYNKDNVYADVVVWNKDVAYAYGPSYIYAGTVKGVDDNGEVCLKARIVDLKEVHEVALLDEGWVTGLEIGDIVQVAISEFDSKIYSIKKLYDIETGQYDDNVARAFYNGYISTNIWVLFDYSFNLVRAQAVDREGAWLYLKWLNYNQATNETSRTPYNEIVNLNNVKVVVYDKTNARNSNSYVRHGDISDIMDLKTSGGQTADNIVCVLTGSDIQFLYVIKP